LLLSGAALAQPPAERGQQAAQHMEQLATLLDLTDAQKAQVQAVLEEEHAKMRAAHEQAKASGTKPDWSQMQAMHEQIQQEIVQKLTPVLSAAQLKKFQTLQQMHGDMMHGHFGHGGGAPPPQN
jgi:hypothetical protein